MYTKEVSAILTKTNNSDRQSSNKAFSSYCQTVIKHLARKAMDRQSEEWTDKVTFKLKPLELLLGSRLSSPSLKDRPIQTFQTQFGKTKEKTNL